MSDKDFFDIDAFLSGGLDDIEKAKEEDDFLKDLLAFDSEKTDDETEISSLEDILSEKTEESGETEAKEKSAGNPEEEKAEEKEQPEEKPAENVHGQKTKHYTPGSKKVIETNDYILNDDLNEARNKRISKFSLSIEDMPGSDRYDGIEEEGNSNIMDSVEVRRGENIFEAVEKIFPAAGKRRFSKDSDRKRRRNSKVYDKIDTDNVKKNLAGESNLINLRFMGCAVIFVFFTVTEFIKYLYGAGHFNKLSAIAGEKSYIAYLVLAAVSFVLTGIHIFNFIRKNNDSDTPFIGELSLLVLCGVNSIYDCALIAFHKPLSAEVVLFNAAVALCCLVKAFADRRENKMISANLETLLKNDRFYGVYPLENQGERIASGLARTENAVVLCSGEIELPNSFLDSSKIKDKQNAFHKISLILSLSFSAVCALTALFTYESKVYIFTSFMMALCLFSPVFMCVSLALRLAFLNRKLNASDCEILGFEAIESMEDADGIILDSSNVFRGAIDRYIPLNAGVDNMMLLSIACAVLIESDGILKKDALKIVKDYNLTLPEIESLMYEDRLGLSCWVENKRFILGTKQMMISHNIAFPEGFIEDEDDEFVHYYIAFDSAMCAALNVGYYIYGHIKRHLQNMCDTNVTVMMMTVDSGIDENFLSDTLEVDFNYIKVINSANSDSIKKQLEHTSKQKRTGLIFSRDSGRFLRVITSALKMNEVQSDTLTAQYLCMALAFIISMLLIVFATGFFLNSLLVVVFHIIWVVLSGLVISGITKGE